MKRVPPDLEASSDQGKLTSLKWMAAELSGAGGVLSFVTSSIDGLSVHRSLFHPEAPEEVMGGYARTLIHNSASSVSQRREAGRNLLARGFQEGFEPTRR